MKLTIEFSDKNLLNNPDTLADALESLGNKISLTYTELENGNFDTIATSKKDIKYKGSIVGTWQVTE